MSTKYQPLADYLAGVSSEEVQMSFKDIEHVLGSKLPAVAYSSPAFWANSKTNDSHSWSHLWQLSGWRSSHVDLAGQKLVFRREAAKLGTTSLTPKQMRILQVLAKATDWTARKQMEDETGPKGFSKALGAPTTGTVAPGTLEALKLVERADGPPPFSYRITELGRKALEQFSTTNAPPLVAADTLLALTENEVYAGDDFGWEDKTGERYEFPNRYKSLVVPGSRFVYYKGRRRADGSSASPEYYGHGVVGEVKLSDGSEGLPAAKRRWTATIRRWDAFDEPVAFQAEDGRYLETGTASVASNYWRDGVRRIGRANYIEILVRGGANPPQGKPPTTLLVEDSGPLVPAAGSLITKPQSGGVAPTRKQTRPRRSKQATVIGKAAEKLFFELLRSQAPANQRDKIRWLANEGVTPGYDIQDDRDPDGIMAYEVKGTTGTTFSAVDITANELECARKLQSKYALVLISGVGSSKPEYQVISNLHKWLEEAKAVATPIAFSLAFHSEVL